MDLSKLTPSELLSTAIVFSKVLEGDKFPLKVTVIHDDDEVNYYYSEYSKYKFNITDFKSLKCHGYDSRSWELLFDDFVSQLRELVIMIKEIEPLLMQVEK